MGQGRAPGSALCKLESLGWDRGTHFQPLLPVPTRSECGLPGSLSLEDHEHSLPLPYTLPSPWGVCLRTKHLLPMGHSMEASTAPTQECEGLWLSTHSFGPSVSQQAFKAHTLPAGPSAAVHEVVPVLSLSGQQGRSKSVWFPCPCAPAPGTGLGRFRADNEQTPTGLS